MNITKENITEEMVVDMGWKIQGLPKLMREQGDSKAADSLERLRSWAVSKFNDKSDPIKREFAYKAMETMSHKHGEYDSKIRRFHII